MLLCSTCNCRKTGLGPHRSPVCRWTFSMFVNPVDHFFNAAGAAPPPPSDGRKSYSHGAGPGRGVHSAAVRGCGLHGGATRPLRRSAIWHAPGASTFGNSRPCKRRIHCHLRGVPARKADQALQIRRRHRGWTRSLFSNCHCSARGLVAACPPRRRRPIQHGFLEPLAVHERLADLWGGKPL